MTGAFDRPASGPTRDGRRRLIGLDVSRAIALIGVVVMNYRGMIGETPDTQTTDSLIERIFDIRSGVLSTRFAAAFVVVAGIGVTLLSQSARSSNDSTRILDARVRLVRRGVVLLVAGYFLDMVWPGTILFYYGVYFIFAAVLFNLGSRTLAVIALANIAVTLGVSIWRRDRKLGGHSTSWISPGTVESVQDFLARVFLGYAHPVLPWLVFFIAGMLIGRHLDDVGALTRRIALGLVTTAVVSYLVVTAIRSGSVDDHAVIYVVTSMQPDERGLGYVVSTLCIAVLAFVVTSAIAERHQTAPIVTALQRAGQLSLTLYLGHVLFYYAIVEWLDWSPGSGLGSAISLALSYWVLAIAAGSWWHHRIGAGPAEWIYRRLGG